MKYAGLDIGTTTISGVVTDTESAELVESKTILNSTRITSENKWESLQDPVGILRECKLLLGQFTEKYPDIAGIGITGQMHGILYVDANGKSVGPLATWQDERGNLEYKDGGSFCAYMTDKTGYSMATGFGMTTHFYNERIGNIPKQAAALCTIGDYIAMSLCGNRTPVMHASNAASIGLFDMDAGCFDEAAMSALGLDLSILPKVAEGEPIIGRTSGGIPVVIPIGDNQASYAGSVGAGGGVLVNIGTGSQISLAGDRFPATGELEARPYIGGKFLLAGSGLCGGYSFQLLRDMFAEFASFLNCKDDADIYDILDKCARQAKDRGNSLSVDTRFRGSRGNPQIRGAITGIGADNFTPGHLALGVLNGIVSELFAHYENMPEELKKSEYIVGSGNAIRKNGLLGQLLTEAFHKDIKIPHCMEEAAFGAALLAVCAVEGRSYEAMADIIQYI